MQYLPVFLTFDPVSCKQLCHRLPLFFKLENLHGLQLHPVATAFSCCCCCLSCRAGPGLGVFEVDLLLQREYGCGLERGSSRQRRVINAWMCEAAAVTQ
jgi:hypothetical protein